MIRFIEVTSIQGVKVLINARKIVSIYESINVQHTYVYFNGDDYIKVKETYKEIRQLIEDASQDNSKNSKAPKMLEEIKESIKDLLCLQGSVHESLKVDKRWDGVYELLQKQIDRKKQLIKEATEI